MEGTWVGKARLLRNLVVAGFAAVFAVVQAVFPEPYIQLALAEAAVLLTVAALFDLFALTAAGFSLGCHRQTLAPKGSHGERAVGNLQKALTTNDTKDRAGKSQQADCVPPGASSPTAFSHRCSARFSSFVNRCALCG